MLLSRETIAKAKGGDRQAFGQLYESVALELYKVALYTLGNPEDAEDAVSETFLEAWKGISGLREEDSFRPWIFRILSARCKRKISGYIKERVNIDLEDYLEEGVEDRSPRRAEVLEVMNRLTPEEREIVVLSVLEGYTMREIAQIKELPQGTVSSKLHRTLKKLRQMLND